VVALVKQHLHQVTAQLRDMRCLVLDGQVGGDRLRAGRDAAPARLDRADPAAALMAQPLVIAKPRDVDPGGVGGLHDRLARLRFDLDPVDDEGEGPSLRKIPVEDVGPALGDLAGAVDGRLDIEGCADAVPRTV
jgi:hypothetical protein